MTIAEADDALKWLWSKYVRPKSTIKAVPAPITHVDLSDQEILHEAYYGEISKDLSPWVERYLARVKADALPAATRAQRMNAVNPTVINGRL